MTKAQLKEQLNGKLARIDEVLNDPELDQEEYEHYIGVYANICWELKDLEEGVRFLD